MPHQKKQSIFQPVPAIGKHPAPQNHPNVFLYCGSSNQLKRERRIMRAKDSLKEYKVIGTERNFDSNRELIHIYLNRQCAAISSKSYWYLSKTWRHTGMTNDWLTRQGLISVRALWMHAHGYT